MAGRDVVPVTILVFLVSAFVLHVTALATPEWSFLGVQGVLIRMGLFQRCIGGTCERIREPSDQIKASGAFGVMAALALLSATSTAFLGMVREVAGDVTPRIVKVVAFLLTLAAATLLIICIVTYITNDTKGVSLEIGFSLKISISAACLSVLALMLLLVDIIGC